MFAPGAFSSGEESTEDRNRQVARIISALGETGAGRRAVLRAIALRQGIENDDEIEAILHGRFDRKIDAPPGLREVLGDIGLGPLLAPANMLMTVEKESILAATNGQWENLEFEVALDSGSVVHICAPVDCPGDQLQEWQGSHRGQEFLMGAGGRAGRWADRREGERERGREGGNGIRRSGTLAVLACTSATQKCFNTSTAGSRSLLP